MQENLILAIIEIFNSTDGARTYLYVYDMDVGNKQYM